MVRKKPTRVYHQPLAAGQNDAVEEDDEDVRHEGEAWRDRRLKHAEYEAVDHGCLEVCALCHSRYSQCCIQEVLGEDLLVKTHRPHMNTVIDMTFCAEYFPRRI